jgi:hypothetical protein
VSPGHDFGSETRQQLIRRIRGRYEQPNARRVASPLFDTLTSRLDAEVSSRAGRGFLPVKWRLFAHDIVEARSAGRNRVNKVANPKV